MSRSAGPFGTRVARLLFAVTLVCGAVAGAQSTPPSTPAPPYRRGVPDPLEFRGPGRDEPDPEVDEVVLGWFGPGDPDHPSFGASWRGATLALEEENAAGGYRGVNPAQAHQPGKPFRLVPAWSESPWQAGVTSLLKLIYDRRAWAVIGGVDGATTHLALQLALKSHFLLLSPGSTDVSTDRANVPWLFSLAPTDETLASVIVPAVSKAAAGGPFAVAASAEHEGHAALAAARRELSRRRRTPAAIVEFPPDGADLQPAVARVLASNPKALLVLGPARLAGAFVAALRQGGFPGTVVASASAAGRAFHAAAGDAAEGVIAAWWIDDGPASGAFASAYERRWAEAPDAWATNGYDATKLVVAAVRRAGLNRARIRDAVRALAPWTGAGGTIEWDALGRSQRRVSLRRWSRGHLVAVGTSNDPG